VNFEVFNGKS